MMLLTRTCRNDLVRALLILAAWLLLVRIRPFVIHPRCVTDPASCLSATVPLIDREFGGTSGTAEEISNYGQITAGILAFAVPWVFEFFHQSGFKSALRDLLFLVQVIALNGALTELIRLVVQRPRPFVYANPSYYGLEPQNYTSFVSGHTSFTVAVAAGLIFLLRRRGADRRWIWIVGGVSSAIALMTGICRIGAGRHFLTDVIAGAICGWVAALAISALRRGSSTQSPESSYS